MPRPPVPASSQQWTRPFSYGGRNLTGSRLFSKSIFVSPSGCAAPDSVAGPSAIAKSGTDQLDHARNPCQIVVPCSRKTLAGGEFLHRLKLAAPDLEENTPVSPDDSFEVPNDRA